MKIPTGSQFRELDTYTIEHELIESIDLMERAAERLTLAITTRWEPPTDIYVFAGPGNNGGDGLAMARMLAGEGYRVRAWVFNVGRGLSPDCATNLERLLQTPEAEVTEVTQSFDFPDIAPTAVVIDALFGTGLTRPLQGGFASVVRSINATCAHIVSIDVPSGLATEDNSYTDHAVCVHAHLTLTIQLPKLAFLLPVNARCVGQWECVDIGLSKEAIRDLATPYHLIEASDVTPLLRPRSAFGHKGTFGHALLVAGSYGMAGAAVLAGRACMRSGVGKLSIHSAQQNNNILQISIPEAIMRHDVSPLLVTRSHDLLGYQAVGIGPGLGTDDQTASALYEYLSMSNDPMVIDADALNILADRHEWLTRIPRGSILTPHPREFERLVGSMSRSYEMLCQAIQFAAKYQVYVVLKGHHTQIISPTGRVSINTTGNSGMATAGSGDVLTGLLTGLLAQGYPPNEAAVLGVYLHGLAGDQAASSLGEHSLTASDIIDYLPHAFGLLEK